MIPHIQLERKLSKIETLTLAKNYIMALTNVICDIRGDERPYRYLEIIRNTLEMLLHDVLPVRMAKNNAEASDSEPNSDDYEKKSDDATPLKRTRLSVSSSKK